MVRNRIRSLSVIVITLGVIGVSTKSFAVSCEELARQVGATITGYTYDGDPILNGEARQYNADMDQTTPIYNHYSAMESQHAKVSELQRQLELARSQRSPEIIRKEAELAAAQKAEQDARWAIVQAQRVADAKIQHAKLLRLDALQDIEKPFWVAGSTVVERVYPQGTGSALDVELVKVHPEFAAQIPPSFMLVSRLNKKLRYQMEYAPLDLKEATRRSRRKPLAQVIEELDLYVPMAYVKEYERLHPGAPDAAGLPATWKDYPAVALNEPHPGEFIKDFESKYEFRQGDLYSKTSSASAPIAEKQRYLKTVKGTAREVNPREIPDSLKDYYEALQPHP